MSASLRVCVLATRSGGKVRELLPLLKAHGWSPLTLDEAGVVYDEAEEQIEVHDSFEANALAKARYYAARVPYPVFADDSGLAVDALHGAPGVYSKRWCGRDDLNGDALDAANNAHLLKALEAAGAMRADQRGARYVCIAAYAVGAQTMGAQTMGAQVLAGQMPGVQAPEAWARGETRGHILSAPVGEGGFGYDPYFHSADLQASFAVVPTEAKATVSHRGRAFRSLLETLERGTFLPSPVDPGSRLG
jgi:XTP/dITP diphosphohydrolase